MLTPGFSHPTLCRATAVGGSRYSRAGGSQLQAPAGTSGNQQQPANSRLPETGALTGSGKALRCPLCMSQQVGRIGQETPHNGGWVGMGVGSFRRYNPDVLARGVGCPPNIYIICMYVHVYMYGLHTHSYIIYVCTLYILIYVYSKTSLNRPTTGPTLMYIFGGHPV